MDLFVCDFHLLRLLVMLGSSGNINEHARLKMPTCRVDVSFPVSGSVSCLKLHYPSLVVCGHFDGSLSSHQVSSNHWLNMELYLQSLFGLRVHSCTHWLRPRNPPPPPPPAFGHIHIRGRYWSAKIDDKSL
jgi:hypothetical protein